MWRPGKIIKTLFRGNTKIKGNGVTTSGSGHIYFEAYYDTEEGWCSYKLQVVVNGADVTNQLRPIIIVETRESATITNHELEMMEDWHGKTGFTLKYTISGNINISDSYDEEYEDYVSMIVVS